MIQETNNVPLDKYDLISDSKNVVALSLLHNSLVSVFTRRTHAQNLIIDIAMACKPPPQAQIHHKNISGLEPQRVQTHDARPAMDVD